MTYGEYIDIQKKIRIYISKNMLDKAPFELEFEIWSDLYYRKQKKQNLKKMIKQNERDAFWQPSQFFNFHLSSFNRQLASRRSAVMPNPAISQENSQNGWGFLRVNIFINRKMASFIAGSGL